MHPNVRVIANGKPVAADAPMPISGGPDAREGELESLTVTLSGTPGTVTTITLPDWARYVTLTPSDEARFAINEDPEAQGASSDTTIAASAFAVGNTLPADTATVRVLEEGTSRTLRLRSTTASATVSIDLA